MIQDQHIFLEKELLAEAHVIVCRFPFPSWKPVKTIDSGADTVLYTKQTNRFVIIVNNLKEEIWSETLFSINKILKD